VLVVVRPDGVSSEAARRSVGRSPPLLADEPSEDLPNNMGRDVSLVASEAAECSSGVPSLTIVIFTAW
jgi:hypothetical protein